MKYSIEIGKIVEGSLRHDQVKVLNYTKQLITKLEEDGEMRAAAKFKKMLETQNEMTLSAMGSTRELTVPVDSESRTTLADVIYPDSNKTSVILSRSNAEKVDSFILSYQNADKLNSLGIGVSNTLLLYGPPGCGKTKCAYLIAKKLNLPLVIARLDSLISSYLGTTAKNIRTLFEFSQKMPCVLFLDEFDAIAKARDDSNELGELKRVVNSLLQNVDAMSSDSLLLAATNHEQLLDPAVWRRFDYKLEIELPDANAIIEMINVIQNVLSSSQLVQIQAGTTVVLVFDTDVPKTDCLQENIRQLRKKCTKVELVFLAQVRNFEEELVRCTDVERASELTHSRSNKDFKRDFCATTNTRYLLDRHNLVLSKLWTTHPPEEFSFVTSNSDIIKQNAE